MFSYLDKQKQFRFLEILDHLSINLPVLNGRQPKRQPERILFRADRRSTDEHHAVGKIKGRTFVRLIHRATF